MKKITLLAITLSALFIISSNAQAQNGGGRNMSKRDQSSGYGQPGGNNDRSYNGDENYGDRNNSYNHEGRNDEHGRRDERYNEHNRNRWFIFSHHGRRNHDRYNDCNRDDDYRHERRY